MFSAISGCPISNDSRSVQIVDVTDCMAAADPTAIVTSQSRAQSNDFDNRVIRSVKTLILEYTYYYKINGCNNQDNIIVWKRIDRHSLL